MPHLKTTIDCHMYIVVTSAVLKTLRVIYKTFLLLFCLITCLIVSLVVRILYREFNSHRRAQLRVCQFYTSIAMGIWNVKVDVINRPTDSQNYLYVGNHMGFVDVFAVYSHLPCLFVTSMEMKQTPGLGLITDIGCCIYVERRDRTNIQSEKGSLVQALKDGFNVMLYPEGTSSNAEGVLPFKRTLMMAAAEAGVPLHPVVFNFKKINGEDFSFKYRDHVCWWGDLSFIKHIILLLSLESVELELKFLNPVVISLSDDKAEVALRLHKIISDNYIKVRRSFST